MPARGGLAPRLPFASGMSLDSQEMTFSPGASRSGFIRPSPVGPFDEKYDTPYTCGISRCVEPTVIASSALPGSLMVSERPADDAPSSLLTKPNPELPAATTTTT